MTLPGKNLQLADMDVAAASRLEHGVLHGGAAAAAKQGSLNEAPWPVSSEDGAPVSSISGICRLNNALRGWPQMDRLPSAAIELRGNKQLEELRIVLVGKTGVGKSAAANTILGTEEFLSTDSHFSVGEKCGKARREVDGRDLSVIDTPGLFHTELTNDRIIDEIIQCISLSSPGPHVFLVVIQIGRFSPEEQETVEIIQKTFGAESSKYTMVLFTHGDRLKKKTIEEFLSKNPKLADFTDKCRGGYHVFNNGDTNRSQVLELLKKIDAMVAINGGGCYTNEMYKRTENAIEEKKNKILEEQAAARREEEERLRRCLKKEAVKNALKELQEKMERQAREEAERYNASMKEAEVKPGTKCTIQ